MEKNSLLDKIKELENQINILPSGSITKKEIKGKDYYYHRYYENKKRIEKYINDSMIDDFKSKIILRKELESKLVSLKKQLNDNKKIEKIIFNSYVITGNELEKFVKNVEKYKKRECFSKLNEYIYNDVFGKIFILYGLRRTGKTTLIRQTIFEMNNEELNKTAFIQVKPKDSLSLVNKDLKNLERLGYKNVFIDEVTLLDDFIEGASVFSDIYANSGMKIILSGTDSLGFMFTKNEQLYDRCILLHTTFIPYREFENVLGIYGINEYIRYGGTMSLSGINYNENSIFSNENLTNEYIDSAIAKNIQHSLKLYDNGNHFRNLQELYEKNELRSVINRVVEDINHRFTKDILTKEFKSNDLSISARNLRKDSNYCNTILDDINQSIFTLNLKCMLEILNEEEQKVKINEVHAREIKEYLKLLDLIYEIDVRSFPNINIINKNIIITQPGLRYCQAISLIDSLMMDEKFNELLLNDKNYIEKRILNEISGRMMEDIVLLETKYANNKKEVFKLQFAIGEFDMVVFDKDDSSCEIYEIKYSKEIIKDQYKHLIDNEKLILTENKFGPIKNKYVIYRGNTQNVDGIKYINVEEYLKNLKQ